MIRASSVRFASKIAKKILPGILRIQITPLISTWFGAGRQNDRYDSLSMENEGGVSEVDSVERKDKVDIYRDTPIRYLGDYSYVVVAWHHATSKWNFSGVQRCVSMYRCY